MATLDIRSFATIVSNVAAAVQGSANKLLDYSIGSVLRSIAESEAGVALWLQGNILKLLLTTRAATSFGTDLDTWIADYGLLRLGSNAATGFVQFTSFTATSVRYIPVGAQVRTTDMSQTYNVSIDVTNTSYDPVNSRYVIASGTASLIVPVVAVVSGSAANALAGTVSIIASNVTGVDIVTNLVPFVGGSDPESDAQLRARFVQYIASLARATVGALAFAISSLQLGLQSQINENVDPNGSADNGMLTIYVDDGSGATPPAVVQNAQTAVNEYRAASVRAGVYTATILTASVAMTIKCTPGFYVPSVVAGVQVAITAYINALGLGNTPAAGTLAFTRIAFAAYGVAGVQEVVSYSVNSGSADLVPAMGQTVKCTGAAVSGS